MKIKTAPLFLPLSILSILSLSTVFAQYEPYMQVGLPEGAKARFGQGYLGRITYSPNMKDAWISVDTHIGVWIYDAQTLQVRDLLRTPPGAMSMSSSPDGSTLAIGLGDGTIELWDVASGEIRQTLTGVWPVAFSPDGSILAAGFDNGVHLWDVDTGVPHETSAGDFKALYTMRFSPDGSILAAGFDNGVHLWDVDTGALRNVSTGHTAAFLEVHFSRDGDILTTWSEDGNVRLWDVTTSTLHDTFAIPTGTAEKVRFSPDGSILAAGSWDGHVRLWDVDTGTLLNTFNGDTYRVQMMHFSPDGNILATKNENDEKVQLWDVTTGTLHRTLPGAVYSVHFSPDGRTLVTGSRDGHVRLWDVDTGTLRQGLEWESWEHIENVRFSPDGSTLAIGSGDIGSGNGGVRLWDALTGVTHKISPGDLARSLSFSPDGSILAIGFTDTVGLWDVTTRTVHNIIELHHHSAIISISGLSFSPNGSTLTAGIERSYFVEMPRQEISDEYIPAERVSEPKSATVWIWDVTTGHQTATLGKYIDSIYDLCFSPDGRTLAVIAADHLGEVPLLWDDPSDGLIETNIDLWDTATGTCYKVLEMPSSLFPNPIIATKVRFSPDGNTLAAVDGATTHLWDTSTNTFRTSLTGHTNTIFSISFSPDGSTLATGSWDGTARLWDISTGALHKILNVAPWGVTSVSFSPDGDTLAVGSALGIVLLWEVEPTSVTSQLAADANGDGVVNIQDLVRVASQFGQTGENNADVNGDSVVNIQDLVLIAAAFGNAPAAPIVRYHANGHLTSEIVRGWLADAKRLARIDATAQRGIAVLEALLTALTPKETALLPNYPNPFNPETWIPYQLAKSVDVSISIYATDGKLVRTLKLGQQAAGVYESRSRAAYWDGKNEVGEFVASGVYFYTLKAGDFTATRKMLIRK